MPRSERVHECTCQGKPQPTAPQVDEANGVIPGVKIVGAGKAKSGREYPLDVLHKAAQLYEGVLVNVNHPGENTQFRPYEDRFGWIENVRPGPDGLYGDLHINPEHSQAKSFLWWAKHNHKAIGLSHDAWVIHDPVDAGRTVVREIKQVYGVDLVADPSTTNGLKEAVPMDETAPMPALSDAGYVEQIGALIQAIMVDAALDPKARKSKIVKLLGLMDDPAAPAEPAAPADPVTESDHLDDESPMDDEPMDEDEAKEAVGLLRKHAPAIIALGRLLEAKPTVKSTPTSKKPVSVARESATLPKRNDDSLEAFLASCKGKR